MRIVERVRQNRRRRWHNMQTFMPPFSTARTFGWLYPHSFHCGLQIYRPLRGLEAFDAVSTPRRRLPPPRNPKQMPLLLWQEESPNATPPIQEGSLRTKKIDGRCKRMYKRGVTPISQPQEFIMKRIPIMAVVVAILILI